MKKMERYVTELEIDMLELENNETDNEIRIMELEEKING